MTPLPKELIKEFRKTVAMPPEEGNRVMKKIAAHYGVQCDRLTDDVWNSLLEMMKRTNPDWWRCA